MVWVCHSGCKGRPLRCFCYPSYLAHGLHGVWCLFQEWGRWHTQWLHPYTHTFEGLQTWATNWHTNTEYIPITWENQEFFVKSANTRTLYHIQGITDKMKTVFVALASNFLHPPKRQEAQRNWVKTNCPNFRQLYENNKSLKCDVQIDVICRQ